MAALEETFQFLIDHWMSRINILIGLKLQIVGLY